MLHRLFSTLVIVGGLASASPVANYSCSTEAVTNRPSFVNQHDGAQYAIEGDPSIMNVPSYLGRASATFHRAVFGAEVPFLNQNYPIGRSPTRHGTSGGDFTINGVGGLYVFDLEAEAIFYGRCHSRVTIPQPPHFYVVTMTYRPNTRLTTRSFTSDNDAWRTFVRNCYANVPHSFAAVEGPYSTNRGGQLVGAQQQAGGTGMLWQAAFIGRDALNTLTVTRAQRYPTPTSGPAPRCVLL